MTRIRNYFDFLKEILKRESDWDLQYYIQSIRTPEEALSIIKMLDREICNMSYKELTKEMNKHTFTTKEELMNMFGFIVEKQRGYPLWMWEYSDIEDWSSEWANQHWYWHLFTNDD